MYYCYNYESVNVRKWQLSNNRFLHSRLKKVAPFISVKYLKSEYQKMRRCSISVDNSKPIRERAYCLTFIQSSNNWRRECKYSRNIANVHIWWGRGCFHKRTSAKTREDGCVKNCQFYANLVTERPLFMNCFIAGLSQLLHFDLSATCLFSIPYFSFAFALRNGS